MNKSTEPNAGDANVPNLENLDAFIKLAEVMFAHVTDSILLHDAAGHPLYANPAVYQSLGIHSCEALSQYMEAERWSAYRHTLHEVLSSGEAKSMVLHIGRMKLSRHLYDRISFFPIRNDSQQIIGAMVYGCDQNYTHQEALNSTHTQRAYLRSLLDNFPYPIWMKNHSGMFISVNRQFCQEFGYAHPRDVLGKYDFDLFETEMAEQFHEDDLQVMETGQDKRLVQKINRQDGSVYWGYTHKAPVRSDGKIIGTVGFTRDVTEERRLHAEIAELENEYALLINSIPIAIMVYDTDCRLILVNEYYSKLMHRDGKLLLGKKPAESWNPDVVNIRADEYEAHLQRVIQTGDSIFFDMIATSEAHGNTIHDVRLIPRIHQNGKMQGVIAVVQDITDIHQSKQHIEYQAHHDALTGLANRTLLSKHLQQTIAQAEQKHQSVSVMILDLDGFKAINDSLGHASGDLLLQEVAMRITFAAEHPFFCARLGGDEFAIVLDHTDEHPAKLQDVIHGLLNRLSKSFHIQHAECFITASIGVARFPQDSRVPEDLLKFADTAMYAAKAAGRNGYQLYNVNLSRQSQRQFYLSNALRIAAKQHEISLMYQPIVQISDQRMVGVEALCRWQSGSLGKVEPTEFIQTAEQTGQILALGLHMMRMAFDAAFMLNHAATRVIKVSFNISARQFNDPQLVDSVLYLLNQTQCQPDWIKFEITETLLLEYNQDVLQKLNQLNQLGITIVLDDFGTGHSALGYLFKFPIQQIKIDRSFIRDIETNPASAKLVKAVIAMVDSIDKELVAEGVETPKQAELLQRYGCQLVQGYLYSKPVSLQVLLEMARY